MKLYCVYNRKTDEIKAHTRDKELFEAYLKTLNKKKFRAIMIDTDRFGVKDDGVRYIKKIEDDHFDKTLAFTFSLDEPATEDEKGAYELAEEEYSKLKFVVTDLKNIIDNYDLSDKDKKQLKKAHKILKELSKRKNFDEAIGLNAIIHVVKNSALGNLKKLFTSYKGKRQWN